jgi:hypothetical protein
MNDKKDRKDTIQETGEHILQFGFKLFYVFTFHRILLFHGLFVNYFSNFLVSIDVCEIRFSHILILFHFTFFHFCLFRFVLL